MPADRLGQHWFRRPGPSGRSRQARNIRQWRHGSSRRNRNRGDPALVGVRLGHCGGGGTGGLLFGSGGGRTGGRGDVGWVGITSNGVMVAPMARVDPAAKSRRYGYSVGAPTTVVTGELAAMADLAHSTDQEATVVTVATAATAPL